jgi:serine/threonine protein kinase
MPDEIQPKKLAAETITASRIEDQHDPLIGQTIAGKYLILECIGEGGFGAVYRANDLRLHRVVALKILHGYLQKDSEVRKRFEREARSLSKLSHPNLASVSAGGYIDDDKLFFVMEFIDGKSVRELLDQQPQGLPWEEAIEIVRQCALGLAAVHKEGLIHRDFKPSNAMVTTDDAGKPRAIVMDFGLVKSVELVDTGRLTKTGMTVGTVSYMSPEQAAGMQVDRRGDLYSLGTTLFEMLTGRRPFIGDHLFQITWQQNTQPAPSVNEFRKDVPQWVAQIVAKCIDKDPDQRFQSAEELCDAITEGQAGKPMSFAGPKKRLYKGGWVVFLLVLPILAGLAVGMVGILRSKSSTPVEDDRLYSKTVVEREIPSIRDREFRIKEAFDHLQDSDVRVRREGAKFFALMGAWAWGQDVLTPEQLHKLQTASTSDPDVKVQVLCRQALDLLPHRERLLRGESKEAHPRKKYLESMVADKAARRLEVVEINGRVAKVDVFLDRVLTFGSFDKKVLDRWRAQSRSADWNNWRLAVAKVIYHIAERSTPVRNGGVGLFLRADGRVDETEGCQNEEIPQETLVCQNDQPTDKEQDWWLRKLDNAQFPKFPKHSPVREVHVFVDIVPKNRKPDSPSGNQSPSVR